MSGHGWQVEQATAHVGDQKNCITRWYATCLCGWTGPERVQQLTGAGTFICGRGSQISGRDRAAQDAVAHIRGAA